MDDNLVMEIYQADMVTEEVETTLEEVKKPEIPAEAGQVKSLRAEAWIKVWVGGGKEEGLGDQQGGQRGICHHL